VALDHCIAGKALALNESGGQGGPAIKSESTHHKNAVFADIEISVAFH